MNINLKKTREAAIRLSGSSEKERNAFLRALSAQLAKREKSILRANERDVAAAKKSGLAAAFVERLVFDSRALKLLKAKVRSVENLRSRIGEVMEQRTLRKGLVLKKVRVPLGVMLVIYESRPEVTIDVAALCIKSGNAALLKGGSEAKRTNEALFGCVQDALKKTGLAKETVGLVPNRDAVKRLLREHESIDLVIARGGYGLVRAVVNESMIPVLAHAEGGARIFVDKSADLTAAEKILLNAKISKPAACNSLDAILVHRAIAGTFVPRMVKRLREAGVRVLGDARARRFARMDAARARDWDKEFLGPTVAIKTVKNAREAIQFINEHTKRHSEGLIARDARVIKEFTDSIDAAALFINASTRLHDGYVFGLGSEMGIAAGKLHARGPVGLQELTTYKWEVYGKGHIR
ncbi:glutamate-5-semialdehyde dehydrogenase [Candidatus Kaiserbacteria bacterium RIFCSPHIGHO2_02_FULL_59_21]|uniref:Gamma-glutamyl phosphate reductase n=1 Tax=Candidatus Kaiserbacteria bacterium RIFCSPHIGHO2_02_FULL_59_21 TaxID=1798500 RepID=A0A1F6E0P5_9BACT|nr:MAG: glutamate-5-semialdehyde dehydrogenase [Candidatus Kaiserbacteria bacterium RIFCSPHIGHO2_01_FULL_58_22]OGG67274.1 MAG: glutamate-5-semialdehyde dehydrogenase [Candidatus Kaiserbacteria bacterium RIFCSPHIGHO2_02_FULL_59_21]OGG86300.1 MAG: glutamate-5-semialdehyde dehydrogenase [Candidatus Kaiserbacteria bacterium RIFCSPLOWO2_02_FULL_59_19]